MKTTKALLLLCAATVLAAPVAADDHRFERRHDRRGPWQGPGDIHRFHERDLNVWRRGHWQHGRHDGRLGWWWVVGTAWYFYPAPVYPYPNPYEPPVVVTPAAPPPPPEFWYYCDNPAGYYPYVAQCPTGWRKVPARP